MDYRLPYTGSKVSEILKKADENLPYLINDVNNLKQDLENLIINAKSYGAKGDGATDDSPLLNDLVTKLNTEGGGTIYLPDGKYRLNSRITCKSNVSLIGESYNAVLMPYCDNSMSQGFAAISWLNTDGTSQGVYDGENPMVNCHFSNFTIDGINQNPSNYDSYPKGINIHFLKDCTFEKIQFLNTFATGLGVDFLENVFINNIYCYNCGRGYVVTSYETISGGAGIGIGTMGMGKESCIISDCITDSCGNYGIFLEGGAIFPENGCESHYTIANCQCINGRNYGIAVKGTDNVIVANNIMRNNARDGFAMLQRDSRRCVNVQVVGNLSTLNSGCGFRFADGDNADYISEHIYVKDNVSYNNTKDGILFSTIITNTFVENNIFKSNNRGVAISNNTYNELYFMGNRVIDCVTNLVFDGLFNNKDLFNNQLVRMCGVHEKEYDMVYVDDNGNEIEHASSKTTRKFTYCKGSLYCGFYFESAYEQTDTESRICYCHWYDENMNFISREGATVNGSGWKRFTPPEGACYVKYRIGINIGTLENSKLKGVYLMRYMSDRCNDRWIEVLDYTNTHSDELVASVPTDASTIFDYPNYKSGCGGDDGFYRRMYFFGDSTIKGTTTVLGSDRATLCLPYLFLQHVANASGKATTAESTSNKAIGGASFTTSAKTYFGSNGSLISDQITNLNSTQFGSIFISGGINDCRASSTISEFKNSVSDVMDNLGQNLTNENTIVYWITPFLCPPCEGKNSAGLTLQDYRDAIVDVIHSKRKSSNIKHSIIDGRFLGLVDVDTLYYTDKMHPSAVGNEIIAKNIFDLLYDPTIS